MEMCFVTQSINHYLVEVAMQLSKDWGSSLCWWLFGLSVFVSYFLPFSLSPQWEGSNRHRAGSVCWALRRNPRDIATNGLHWGVSLGQVGGYGKRNKSDRSASLTWAVWWPQQGVRGQPVNQRGENDAPESGGCKSDFLPVRVGPKAIASAAKGWMQKHYPSVHH